MSYEEQARRARCRPWNPSGEKASRGWADWGQLIVIGLALVVVGSLLTGWLDLVVRP